MAGDVADAAVLETNQVGSHSYERHASSRQEQPCHPSQAKWPANGTHAWTSACEKRGGNALMVSGCTSEQEKSGQKEQVQSRTTGGSSEETEDDEKWHKLSAYLASARLRKIQDIGEMTPIPLVSLTPGYKIVKRTSSNTVPAAYVNGYKLPSLYPSSYGFLIYS
jgi:hypothetical protein